MGSSSRHRDRSRDRGDRGRDRDKDRDRERRERRRSSRDRDRHRDRDRSRRERSRDREKSRDRDRSSRDKSHGKSREKSKEKSPEPDGQKLLAETLATIAASRNYASLVAAKEQEELEANMTPEEREREERRRRRKSRWGGSEHDKTFIPGMPTILPASLNKDQEQAYLIQLQIEDVSRKLRSGDLGIPANIEERSPSPEPIYSSDGKRLNTREFRTRRRLEEDRHNLVLKMMSINPEYKPPIDYKPPVIRVHDKVMIPQEEHPEINFVGLLIGPRGNTLKTMEKETGAKIIIRGKGSVKEGKVGRKDGQPLPGEDEPLHAYITATNPEHVKKAVERIKEVIRQGVEVPENQNDLRRMQLRELAQLNGTLRENEGMRCNNCGASDHKSWLCPDKPNVTNNIVCSSCGGAGHIARDCRQKRPGLGGPPQPGDKAKIDEEYMSLMAELGEGPPADFSQNGGFRRTNGGSTGGFNLFDRSMAPRAIMPGAPRPDMPQMMAPNQMAPPPWPPAPAMTWQPTPPGLMPPPPPPGASSPPNVPPLMSWMGAANNQPPPPGAGTTPTNLPPPMQQRMQAGAVQWQQQSMTMPPGTMQPRPQYQWPQSNCMPPPPPGIDMNQLLAAPPPPPPS